MALVEAGSPGNGRLIAKTPHLSSIMKICQSYQGELLSGNTPVQSVMENIAQAIDAVLSEEGYELK